MQTKFDLFEEPEVSMYILVGGHHRTDCIKDTKYYLINNKIAETILAGICYSMT